jgi:hypothetical protein
MIKKFEPDEREKKQRKKKQIHWTFAKAKKDEKENIREIQSKDKETIAKGPKRGCIHEGTFTDDNTCPGKLS